MFAQNIADGIDKSEILATGGKGEIGMEFGPCRSVFAGRKNDQELVRAKGNVRELPFVQVGFRIGQRVFEQIDWRRRRIVDFNPITRIPVGILKSALIRSEKLRDDRRARRSDPIFEQFHAQSFPTRESRSTGHRGFPNR